NPVAAIDGGVDQPERRHTVLDHLDRLLGSALFFREIAVGRNDETEVPNTGAVEPGRVDFIENAVADREPDPAFRTGRRAHGAFRTRCPAWRNPRSSARHREIGQASFLP